VNLIDKSASIACPWNDSITVNQKPSLWVIPEKVECHLLLDIPMNARLLLDELISMSSIHAKRRNKPCKEPFAVLGRYPERRDLVLCPLSAPQCPHARPLHNLLRNPALSGSSSHRPGHMVTQWRYSILQPIRIASRGYLGPGLQTVSAPREWSRGACRGPIAR
jgi:hypothetical protein